MRTEHLMAKSLLCRRTEIGMSEIRERARQLNKNYRRSRARKLGISLLALAVLVSTAASLLLPAFTMEKPVFCGYEEHVHSEDCYESVLRCGRIEAEEHVHGPLCVNGQAELTCESEDPGHTHDESCWAEVQTLACGLEEAEGHTHTDECYDEEQQLVCVLEESEGHLHSEDCYRTEQELICGEEERPAHVHGPECFTLPTALVCTADHEHDESCYAPEPYYICGLAEGESHTHDDACFEQVLICGREEHTHTLACYADASADLESEESWIKSFPHFDVNTPPAERLLGIARSQLGYSESGQNYLVREDDTLSGYTRYGDWYGDPYADWDAIFLAFCMYYADVDSAHFPAEGDSAAWMNTLAARGLYVDRASGYVPQPGDLVFLEEDSRIRVGLIERADEELGVLHTIEGDRSDAVSAWQYSLNDGRLLGYGVLPDMTEEESAVAETAEPLKAASPEPPAVLEDEPEDVPENTLETAAEDKQKTDKQETAQENTQEDVSEALEPASEALLTAGGEVSLTDIAAVSPTKLVYTDAEHDAALDFEFKFDVPKGMLPTAKNSSPWVYDLSSIVGDGKVLKDLNGSGGTLWKGSERTGTYTIEGSKIYIYPHPEYLQHVTDDLHGTFKIQATLNENVNQTEDKTTIEFPGGGTAVIHYKDKNVTHYKTVGAAENSANAQSGDVQVIEQDGKYYLYYRIYMNPDGKLSTLTLTDTLSDGQTLDQGSFVFTGNGQTITDLGSALTGLSGQGFTLNVAELMKDNGGINGWQEYILTYRTEVDKSALNNGLMENTANYQWDGGSDSETTKVVPHFDEELETNKSVKGYEGGYVTQGDVDVKEENGETYLYYRVTAKPNTKIDKLELTDTVGPGQEIDETSFSLTVGDETVSNPFSVNGQTISGTLEREIPAGTEVVLTYRVKLTKNADTDESVLSGVKENSAEWKWKGEPSTDTTTVTPRIPDPVIPIRKLADPDSAKPGDTINYTVTFGSDETDLRGKTFTDRIANYPLTLGEITVKDKDGNPVNVTVQRYTPGDSVKTGEIYRLFDFTFPDDQAYTGEYTLTYSITVSAETDLAGKRALLNRGSIGNNSDDTTTTIIDYPSPKVDKEWTAFDKTDNTVLWTIRLNVPEGGKTYKNVVLTERDFSGGESQWYLGDVMPLQWDTLSITEKETGEKYSAYWLDKANNVLHFNELSKSLVITVRTALPEGKSFAALDTYYVRNGVDLTVDGEGQGGVTPTKKYERADYGFVKNGEFDPDHSNIATWWIVLNEEGHAIEPDTIPYFVDTIPDGMKLHGDSIHITVDGHGNQNRYNSQIWSYSVDYPYSTSDNQIGRINLVQAVRNGQDARYAPSGLSGMTYIISYQTELTEEKLQQMQAEVGTYNFTNKAKIVDENGRSVKTTSDTIEYVYEDLVEKTDISTPDDTGKVDKIKYRVEVNKNRLQVNDGKTMELYDVFGTDMTLITNTLKVWKVEEDGSSTQVYDSNPVSGVTNSADIVVGYEDNMRKLQIFLPDETYYIVEYEVKPNAGDGTYKNTVILHGERFSSRDTVEKEWKVNTGGTLAGRTGEITLKKMDQYDISKSLPGAEFSLYQVILDDNGAKTSEIEMHPHSGDVFITDNSGLVTFSPLEEGKLYYWQETKAPDKYMLTDDSPHYFVVYKEYEADRNSLSRRLPDYPLDKIEDYTPEEGRQKLDWYQLKLDIEKADVVGSNGRFMTTALDDELLQRFVDYLNEKSRGEAKQIDKKAQEANGIIVATVAEGYIWNWRNIERNTYAVLEGEKFLIGREMKDREFVFELYDITDHTNPVRLQRVTNGAGVKVEGKDETYTGSFHFNDIPFVKPGVYSFLIVENTGADPLIVYDRSEYYVTVTVTQHDIDTKQPIPSEQIVYKKNGQPVEKALFFNHKDEANLTIHKTFSGSYVGTDSFEKSGVKNRLSFTVRDERGRKVASVGYKDMKAGTITLTARDGIESGHTYTVEEQYADISGTVRTTIYTVKAVSTLGDKATVNTKDNKAAEVSFDNAYEPERMMIPVLKRWYTIEKKGDTEYLTPAEAPSNMREVYFKLQRYVGPEPIPEKTGAEDWIFLDRSYEPDPLTPTYTTEQMENAQEKYSFSAPFVVKADMGWALELEDLPIARYRVVEVEPSGTQWKIVSHGNVLYSNEVLQKDTVIPKAEYADDTGVTREDLAGNGNHYMYNRLYKVEFIKHWEDEKGNPASPFELGVRSLTLQLQSATCSNPKDDYKEQVYGTWHDVRGQTATLLFNGDGNDPTSVTFNGIVRKDSNGNNLYYRVVETEIRMRDGTVLSGADEIEKAFSLRFEPVGKKTSDGPSDKDLNAYMKPGDGEDYSKQNFYNTKKPTGITVEKFWDNTSGEKTDVYFVLQKLQYGSFQTVTGVKADDGTEPNEQGVYTLHYDPDTGENGKLSFSYLFRKNADGTLSDSPIYNWNKVDAVRFMEVKSPNDPSSYNDDSHAVVYTFRREGESADKDVTAAGIDAMEIGSYTIVNRDRKPSKLEVTKSWTENSEKINKIYFKVYALAEDGSEQVLYKGLSGLSISPENVQNDLFYLNCTDTVNNVWETVSIDVATKLSFNYAEKYVAGFYVIETDMNGSPLPDDRRIEYTYSDGEATIKGVSKTVPIQAGGSGTLTIDNNPADDSVKLSVQKQWKKGEETATAWPGGVASVSVQLWRKTETGAVEQVGDAVTLTAANPVYHWDRQDKADQDGKLYTYYIEEVNVVARVDGSMKTITGTDLDAWFDGTAALPDKPHTVLAALDGKISFVTNKPPEEETTNLKFTKRWMDKDGKRVKPVDGETITLRLWSKTDGEQEAAPFLDLTDKQVQNAGVNAATDSETQAITDQTLTLTAANGEWPTAELTLPKYRGGQLIRYYLEEIGVSGGNHGSYLVSYEVNGEPQGDAQSKPISTGRITIVNTETSKYVEVEKLWDDELSHAGETVTVQLYRWTDAAITPPEGGTYPKGGGSEGGGGEDADTMTLNIEIGNPTESTMYWSFKLDKLFNASTGQIVRDVSYEAKNDNDKRTHEISSLPVKSGDTPITYKLSYGYYAGVWGASAKVQTCRVYLDGILLHTPTAGTNGEFSFPASSGTHTLHVTFEEPASLMSIGTADHAALSANVTNALTLDQVPEGAESVGDPVILNSGRIGWSYRWENLEAADEQGKTYHYAAAETELSGTSAEKNTVTYTYYYSDKTQSVGTLDTAKDVVRVEITNKPQYSETHTTDLRIVKVDAQRRETRLSGATFRFYVQNGTVWEYLDSYEVGTDGVIISGLTPGSYKLEEYEAPPGYVVLDNSEVYFEVTDTGVKVDAADPNVVRYESGVLSVGNYFAAALPATGGMGSESFTLGGAALLLLSLGGLLALPILQRLPRGRSRKGGRCAGMKARFPRAVSASHAPPPKGREGAA